MSEDEKQFVTLSGLRQRGWTSAMVRRFLPEGPDHLKQNPVFRTRAPMQLYAEERVQAIEGSQAFVEAQDESRPRRERRLSCVERQRCGLLKAAHALKIRVKVLDQKGLLRTAINHYNDRQTLRCFDRGWEIADAATPASSKAFLERIMVNYVRHELTHYDGLLEALFGKVGVDEATAVVRERVYEAIGAAYPRLKEEAERQLKERVARLMCEPRRAAETPNLCVNTSQ